MLLVMLLLLKPAEGPEDEEEPTWRLPLLTGTYLRIQHTQRSTDIGSVSDLKEFTCSCPSMSPATFKAHAISTFTALALHNKQRHHTRLPTTNT
jgi:hypothetical protein